MKLLSQEVVDRLRDKIPEIKNLKGVDPYIYGMTHLDIVDEDNKVIKQMGKSFFFLLIYLITINYFQPFNSILIYFFGFKKTSYIN